MLQFARLSLPMLAVILGFAVSAAVTAPKTTAVKPYTGPHRLVAPPPVVTPPPICHTRAC